jgi:adenylosuccinate synthase
MMKADVLSSFASFKVCTQYNYKGTMIDYIPFEIKPCELIPVYTEIKGWGVPLDNMNSVKSLPIELNRYIDLIETSVNTPVTIISVGPDRVQTIRR